MLVFGATEPVYLESPELVVTELDVGKAMLELDIGMDTDTLTTFDLIVSLAEKGDGIAGAVIYKSAFFTDATVDRIMAAIDGALAACASAGGEPVS
jgi:hypothetical protein